MLTYRFNLAGRGTEKDYKKIAAKALRVARSASAVDTGSFRRGWKVSLSGDLLSLTNAVRYAAPVELGSSVHKKHKHRVRNALLRMGLGTMQTAVGSKVIAVTASQSDKVIGVTDGVLAEAATPSGILQAASTVTPLTLQEIRSPALIRNRFKAALPTLPSGRPATTKAQLFNRDYLLAAIAAAVALSETEQEQEE